MPICGSFETDRELHRGVRSVVYAARRTGDTGPATAAATVLQPSAIHSEAEQEEQVKQFLARVEVQRTVAAGGSPHWAPVHESGRTGGGAFFVTDLFGGSAVTLITGVDITSPRLYHVVNSVVSGLIELDRAAGRAHGNLKPTNVLVGGARDLANARIVLTDPLPPARLRAKEDRQADLRAIGELIFQLVLHQPVPSARGFVTGGDPKWNALGPHGEEWRTLCNRLLDPAGARAIHDLPTLAEELAHLAPAARRVPAWAYAAGIVPVVAGIAIWLVLGMGGNGGNGNGGQNGGGGGGSGLTAIDQKDALCSASLSWLLPFVELPPTDDRHARLAGSSRLAAALEKVSGADDVSLDLRVIFAEGGSPARLGDVCRSEAANERLSSDRDLQRRVSRAYERFVEIETMLDEELAAMASLAGTYRERTWDGPASLLEKLAAEAAEHLEAGRASRGRGLVECLDDIMRVRQLCDGSLKPAHESEDPVLRSWARHIAQLVSGSLTGFELRAALDEAEMGAAKMIEAQRRLEQDIDVTFFRSESKVHQRLAAGGGEPTSNDFVQWVDELGRLDAAGNLYYAKLPAADDPTRGWAWESQYREFERLRTDVARACTSLPPTIDPERDLRDVEQLRQTAQTLVALDFNRGTQGRKESGIREYDQQMGGLLARYRDQLARCTIDFALARSSRAQEVADPARVNRYRYRGLNDTYAAVIQSQLDSIADDQAFSDAATALTELLDQRQADLGEPLRLDTGGLPVDLSRLADAEQAMVANVVREALRGVTSPPQFDDNTAARQNWDSGLARIASWRERAGELIGSTQTIVAMLEGAYRPDEPGPDGLTFGAAAQAWRSNVQQMELASAFAGIEDRLRALDEIGSVRDRDELTRRVDISQPEIRLAAWRALASWADEPEGLSRERQMKPLLDAAVAGIGDPVRRDAVRAEIEAGHRARWGQFVKASSNAPARIDEALAAIDTLGIDLDALDESLAPVADVMRYDKLLFDLRQALTTAGDLDDAAAQRRIETYLAEASSLLEKLPAAQRTRARDWHETLRQVASGDLQTTRPDEVGPGHPDLDGRGLRWTLADPDAQMAWLIFTWGDHRLTFVQAPMEGDEAVYVCATEVSLGLFRDVVQSAGAGSVMEGLLEPAGRGDRRRGPRVWEWSARTRQLSPASSWYDADRAWPNANSMFPDGQLPPVPAEGLPMQYVSPHAAALLARLTGCRLPSVAEWQAALAQELGRAPSGGAIDDQSMREYVTRERANLRDRTWARQRDFVGALDVTRKRFPDEQAFIDISGSTPRQALAVAWSDPPRAWDLDDGVLFFAPVEGGGGGGGAMRHLVGNVAELVVRNPEPLDQVEVGRADAEAVAQALAAAGCGVIGGSALSPPDLPLTLASELSVRAGPPDENQRRGHADVGFRLAFTASGLRRSVVDTLRQLLAEADRYVYPE